MYVRHSAAGYTLIEVLIASSIFVSVMMIATATFTTSSRIREKTQARALATDTARSVIDAMSRDVRTATGIRTPSGSFAITPFALGGRHVAVSGLETGSILETVRFDGTVGDVGQTTVREYYVDDGNSEVLTLRVRSRTYAGAPTNLDLSVPAVDETTALLPDELAVADGGFVVSGITHERELSGGLPRVQPFVQLALQLRYVGDPRNAGTTQSMQTTVTSREYLE